jgi:hypothetical protein
MSLKALLQKELDALSDKELLERWEEIKKTKNLITMTEELMTARFLKLLGDKEETEVAGRKIRMVQGARYSYTPATVYSIIGDTDMFVEMVKVDNKKIDAVLKEDDLSTEQKRRIKLAKISTPTKPFVKIY